MKREYRYFINCKKVRDDFFTIKTPSVLSINDKFWRQQLIIAIEKIHIAIENKKYKIKLDFTSTSKIYSSAMILLYAEMKNILNINKKIMFSCIKPRNSKASHVLYQIGVYDICRMQFKQKQNFGDVIYWRVCSGVDVIGKNYDKIVDNNNEIFDPEVDLYGGCVEATKNVKRHAYIERREMSEVAFTTTGWWIFSQVKDGNISVSVCDLGCSIPATLPKTRKSLFQSLLSLGKNSDASLIRGAIEGAQSRSGENHRGNGLPRIAHVASKTSGAYLDIHSRNGYIRIGNKNCIEDRYKIPIQGTIISWTLPLEVKK